MLRLRFFQCAVLVVIVALCAFGQMALAQTHHYAASVAHTQSNGVHANALADGLYPGPASFSGSPYVFYSDPFNGDNSEIWPCFGGGSASPNTDCPTIGNPAQANYGVELGVPSYTFSLTACDATSTSVLPCGQTNTWYEDDSNDTSDDLTYIIEATQGSSVIADSGTVIFGPNPFGGLSPAANVIIYGDQNFGTMGATGKNNGNCDANLNYPVPSLNGSPNPTYPIVIAAGKTCVAPVAGTVDFAATTALGTPTYTKSTKSSVCGSAGTPCYTIKLKNVYSVTQKWNNALE